jgi:Ca2+/Na+ antiporter
MIFRMDSLRVSLCRGRAVIISNISLSFTFSIDEQRLSGAIVLHFAVALYFFIVLAMICSEYFLPSVECICQAMQIPTDVAAATFMALATTIPEFFTNTISTFVTDSDMGIGTIIGSMLFNTLGVSACAALAAPGVI